MPMKQFNREPFDPEGAKGSDFDYEGNLAKLTKSVEDDKDTTFDDLEGDVDKDEEADKVLEGLEKEEPEEEIEEKVKEKASKKEEQFVKEEKIKAGQLVEAEKIKDDMIKYLDGKTKFVIKGKEYDLADISPEEIKNRFSLAGRAWEVMQENSETRKKLDQERKALEISAQQVQGLMNQYGTQRQEGVVKPTIALPDQLKPTEYDSDNEKALKSVISTLYEKLDNVERNQQQQTRTVTERQLLGELDEIKKEYPLASKEEVIAIVANYPNVSMREAAELSHRYYSGDEWLNSVLASRPEKLREIKEQAITEYLTKKAKAQKVARPTSGQTSPGKSTEISRVKKKGLKYGFEDAGADALEMLRGLPREEE